VVVGACAAAVAGTWIVSRVFHGAVPAATAAGLVGLVPAAYVDVRERRLPDRLVGAAGATVLAVAVLGAVLANASTDVAAVAGGATVAALPLLALHLVSPSSMGFGDVKAAAVLGAALGVADPALAVVALALAAGIGAAVGIVRRVQDIAFGPFLVLGGWLAVVTHATGALGQLTAAGGTG
jgi:leader peptidase (prepilin peptidase)/N-methyltransferase